MKNFVNQKTNQAGQTLVETLVAIFIMIMGITAALGLANYSLNASSNIVKQLVAVGLAREGVEAVKNMRDTNWLRLPLGTCPKDLNSDTSITSDTACYINWISGIDTGVVGSYNFNDFTTYINAGRKTVMGMSSLPIDRVGVGNNVNKYWTIPADSYELDYYANGLNTNVSPSLVGFYTPYQSPGVALPSGFSRRVIIRIEGNTSLGASGPFSAYTAVPPYNQSSYERLRVVSQVWWTDQKCPKITDPDSAAYTTTRCKVQIEQVFTNWKNY
jgi:type II secretory pathway pseudopilin PulG